MAESDMPTYVYIYVWSDFPTKISFDEPTFEDLDFVRKVGGLEILRVHGSTVESYSPSYNNGIETWSWEEVPVAEKDSKGYYL